MTALRLWPTVCAGLGEAGIDRDVVALVDALEDVADILLDALRRDAVLGVVGLLLVAAAVGLGDGALHRAGHLVGVEDDAAVDVAGGAADGLHQRGLGAQEALPCRRRGCATRAHSGMSRPSRSRLMPTSTSKAPRRRSRMISMRSIVSMSECM